MHQLAWVEVEQAVLAFGAAAAVPEMLEEAEAALVWEHICVFPGNWAL